MLFDLDVLLSDPLSFLRQLLLFLPGMCLAISVHESGHGWVAEKCGDPTARYAGRITLNPLKHFDPAGFLCMLFIGVGWAKPVPVNPTLFKHYRRDDLKVSLAGITANILLFILCFIIVSAIFTGAVASLPEKTRGEIYLSRYDADAAYRISVGGETEVYTKGMLLDGKELYNVSGGLYSMGLKGSSTYYTVEELIITPAFGKAVSIIYRMLLNCMYINIGLAVFNLLPVPPLDGYHVLNDIVLKRPLFASANAARAASTVILLLIVIGNVYPKFDILSIVIGGARSGIINAFTYLSRQVASLIGVI